MGLLLEKLPTVKPLKKFSAFYGTRRFITVFTRALHWSLSWARSIQFTPSHYIYLRSILILSTHLRLGLPSGLLPSGFPTNILYAFLFSPIRATCPDHLILCLSKPTEAGAKLSWACCCWFLGFWRWRGYVSPNFWALSELHSVTLLNIIMTHKGNHYIYTVYGQLYMHKISRTKIFITLKPARENKGKFSHVHLCC
jgi:hypothetical protein